MNGKNRINAYTVFKKTLKLGFVKLALGAVILLISGILLSVFLGIGILIGEDVIVVMFIVWLIVSGLVNFFLAHYIGYLLKAGHIAVITDTISNRNMPEDQIQHAFIRTKKRYATADIYFLVDSLIGGALRQIQHISERAHSTADSVSGVNTSARISKLLTDIFLGYIVVICLGYTFYKDEQNAYKSAADGIALCYQNRKKLLKNASVTVMTVIILFVLCGIILFLLFLALFGTILPDMKVILALLFAGFLTYVIKYAFIDTWIMIKTNLIFLELAPKTAITYDLYEKLSRYSKKFRKLFNKGQQIGGVATNYSAGGKADNSLSAQPRYPGQNSGQRISGVDQKKPRPVFCNNCSTKNKSGTEFCENCGSKID